MKLRSYWRATLASIVSFPIGANSLADSAPAANSAEQGTVRVPSFDLPPSAYMSEAARRALIASQARPASSSAAYDGDIVKRRQMMQEVYFGPRIERAKALYPVDIKEQRIAGVRTDVVTPKAGVAPENRDRVLIELHPGGFSIGAGAGLIEAIPMAEKLRVKVISIDYRLGPEHKYPAATEDVTAVYKALLEEYKPENIAIFGCSAGGLLTAESVAWFQKARLPSPGAIAILAASADAQFVGDSHYSSAPFSGTTVSDRQGGSFEFMLRNYFDRVDLRDPLVSPVWSRDVLAKFPPTLIATGTRAHDMSATVFTHAQLTKAGVTAELHLFDGLPHGYSLDPELPESIDTYDLLVKFFDRHLGGRRH